MPKLKPETYFYRKEYIMQAALVCFARTCYHQTTMDDIVLEAGLSKGSIYTYFDSKKELFTNLLEKMVSETGLFPILSAENSCGREKLDAAMSSMVAFTTSGDYQYYAPLLMEAWTLAQVEPDVKVVLADIYKRLRQLFAQPIEKGITRGEFKPIDAVGFTNVFLSVFDGLMVQARLDAASINWHRTAHTMQFACMNGLPFIKA